MWQILTVAGNKFWLYALLASFSMNIYKLRWASIRLQQEKRINKPLPGVETKEEYKQRLTRLQRYRFCSSWQRAI
ncbi:hypothetical protein HDV03_004075 [Kappamyces sp. JEL0829]|nr:hypothetical protein HDV03_004075 [Kappamyces sp. JEL0829]